MATAVLHPNPQKFPAGTTVKAYKRSDQPGVWDATGAPAGSQIASATVAADGSVTFTGLADSTAYLLYAASPDRYANFSTPAAAASTAPSAGSVDAAAIADALKPSAGAAAGTEALRALGTTASKAAAGNDSRLSDTRAPSGVPSSGRLGLAAPYDPMRIASGAPNLGNYISGCRVEVAKTGILHDLCVFMRVASGNARLGVYDTGDALAGSRSKLWDSGSVACAGTDVFQVFGDPALAVVAGQMLDFVWFPDNNTAAIGRVTQLAAAQNVLPASFIPTPGGASPKLNWAYNLAYAALPAAITEAQCGASASALWIGGRIA